MTGQALALRVKLKQLMHEHGVVPEPCSVPLSDWEPYPVIVEGFATTPDVDRDRMLLSPQALLPSPYQLERSRLPIVPLLYKHDANQKAGVIEVLHYDSNGRLFVRARVEHWEARQCNAFSVGLSNICNYEIVGADTKQFYCRIERATLDEISLVETPANPAALVKHRRLTDAARATVLRSIPNSERRSHQRCETAEHNKEQQHDREYRSRA